MNRQNLIFTITLLSCMAIFAQKAEVITGINYVELDMRFSKRIPFNHANIQIRKKYRPQKHVEAHVVSKPLKDDKAWEYSKIDTIYNIAQKDFDQIVSLIDNIEIDSIKRGFNVFHHGIQSSLTFGTSNPITFSVGNPTTKMEPNYYEVCEKILSLVGIDPKLFLLDYKESSSE